MKALECLSQWPVDIKTIGLQCSCRWLTTSHCHRKDQGPAGKLYRLHQQLWV